MTEKLSNQIIVPTVDLVLAYASHYYCYVLIHAACSLMQWHLILYHCMYTIII